MKCLSCTVEAPAGARFCHQCGTPLAQVDSAASRLFDLSRQAPTDAEAEARAWETLKSHLEAAKKFNSTTILTNSEWEGRCLTLAWGSVPKVRAMTPFNQIVSALVTAREQYDDLPLLRIEELAAKWTIAVLASSETLHPVSEWKLTIDPEGHRIKPIEVAGSANAAFFRFDGDIFEELTRPITVALWRGPGEKELRYAFRQNMR